MDFRKNKGKAIGSIICIIVVGFVVAFFSYMGNYYHASNPEADVADTDTVKVIKIDNGYFFDGPGEETALIFYPGAKVEAVAYAPLMKKLAAADIDCFLVEMPLRFAFFGMNRADAVLEAYGADYHHWYIAGHSLGGVAAANYVASHENRFEGLVLLASYTATDLSGLDIKTMNIYGTEDGVLNRGKLNESYALMPENSQAVQITGGNHAQFGEYGVQKGDGEAQISADEQQNQTVEGIMDLIRK